MIIKNKKVKLGTEIAGAKALVRNAPNPLSSSKKNIKKSRLILGIRK